MIRPYRTIFFSVGEPSGDLHGANLIRAILKIDGRTHCVGFGGPRMAEANCQLLADLTQYAVMWLARVVAHLFVFVRLLREADRYFRDQQPDAVVLIDYPGFNWWVAWRAKARGIPVFYYGAPQLWAWAGWRIRKMRRLTDYVLCKLPFEEEWFQQRGCRAKYVGHPYFDELAQRTLDQKFCEGVRLQSSRRLTLLPGSRDQEVEKNLPVLLRAAEIVRGAVGPLGPLSIVVASFNEKQGETARALIAATGSQASVCVRRTPELIELSDVCLACSGSVALELMYHEKPAVIVYVVNRLAYFLQNWFRSARFISLVNLLATDRITRRPLEATDAVDEGMPYAEFLSCRDVSGQIAEQVIGLLMDSTRYAGVVTQLRALKRQFGQPGASVRAARLVLECLDRPAESASQLSGPHRKKPARITKRAVQNQDLRL